MTTQGGSRAEGPLLGEQAEAEYKQATAEHQGELRRDREMCGDAPPRSGAVDALIRGIIEVLYGTESGCPGNRTFSCLSDLAGATIAIRRVLDRQLPAILAERQGHDDCGEECPCFERGVEASREHA